MGHPWNTPGTIPEEHEAGPVAHIWVSGSGAQILLVSPRFTFQRSCHTNLVTNVHFSSPFHSIHWWIFNASLMIISTLHCVPRFHKGIGIFSPTCNLPSANQCHPSLPLPPLTLHCNLAAPTMTATVTLTLTTSIVSQSVRRERLLNHTKINSTAISFSFSSQLFKFVRLPPPGFKRRILPLLKFLPAAIRGFLRAHNAPPLPDQNFLW